MKRIVIDAGIALHADKIIITIDGDYGVSPAEHYRSEKELESKRKVAAYMMEILGLNVYTPHRYIYSEAVVE